MTGQRQPQPEHRSHRIGSDQPPLRHPPQNCLGGGRREPRAPGQYYIDPTAAPGGDGLIVARSIGREQAAEFARLPLSAFPSRLPREDPP